MKNLLVLQTLGNNDVIVERKKGSDYIKDLNCGNESELEDFQKQIEEDYRSSNLKIDFPLIKFLAKNLQEKHQDFTISFCIVLTNQRKWLSEKHQDDPDMWRGFSSSDGRIWKNILADWCRDNNIESTVFDLSLDGKVSLGVSDWENVSPLIANLLDENLVSKSSNLFNKSNNQTIDKLLIQHSSGTPALCSALYLWGVEKRLAGKDIEFVYISKESEYRAQDGCYAHNGSHWQWRLLVPQVNQLLDLQDFSGARELISETVFSKAKDIRKELNKLDKLASFNLTEIKQNLSLDDQVIERIAIALWSEAGYRKRGKWMSWITTMAGAFELACNHYLTSQEGWFWQEREITVVLGNQSISKDSHFFIPIGKLVENLLTSGEFLYKGKDREIKLKCQKITDPEWSNFVKFYCHRGWKVSNRYNLSFSHVRNDLYHSLMGDSLDSILDSTANLYDNGAFNERHPAQVAVQQLRSLLEIINLWETVDEKVKKYQANVRSIKEALLR